jgi:hypothetical protein
MEVNALGHVQLAGRGGVWFSHGILKLHLGVVRNFQPTREAHSALLVHGLQQFADRCTAAGHTVVKDEPLEEYDRVSASDPFGNRIELMGVVAAT